MVWLSEAVEFITFVWIRLFALLNDPLVMCEFIFDVVKAFVNTPFALAHFPM